MLIRTGIKTAVTHRKPIYKMSDLNEAMRLWRSADCVCFDVDSTVCPDESIDELASYLGCGEAVANLTQDAMQGAMPFRESLVASMELVKPSQQVHMEVLCGHYNTETLPFCHMTLCEYFLIIYQKHTFCKKIT